MVCVKIVNMTRIPHRKEHTTVAASRQADDIKKIIINLA